MKIALYQGLPTGGDEEMAFAKIRHVLRAAAAAEARMAVFPELFLPGYNHPQLHRDRAQGVGGSWDRALASCAKEAGCGLVIGWAERDGTSLYNAASAYGPDGSKLAHHRKAQLFGPMEKDVFTPGSAYTLFEFEGHTVGLLICYEIEFPEHVRSLAGRGATLVVVPTANGIEYANVPEVLVPARAWENRLSIAYANYCGEDNGLVFSGNSIIVGRDGAPLVTAGHSEALLITNLNLCNPGKSESLSMQDTDLKFL